MKFENCCPGCMRVLSVKGGICPYCGYDCANIEVNTRCLAPYTILAGKYLIGRILGVGGFGITYIGVNMNSGERVAVKEYFPGELLLRDTRYDRNNRVYVIENDEKKRIFQEGLNRFSLEAEKLKLFNSLPGIVSVRDFFRENGTAYLVMEYIEGMDLKQYLRVHGDRLPEEQLIDMVLPLVKSLEEVHRAGIVHRDIAPDNIMVDKTGKVTLIDFGAARFSTGEETRSLTVVLKHGYAPEEQYTSKGKQGPWTDIYALCATMYRAITGRVPQDALERMHGTDWQAMSSFQIDVTPQTENIIRKGMEIDAKKRYQNAAELGKALDSVKKEFERQRGRQKENEQKRKDEQISEKTEKAYHSSKSAKTEVMAGIVIILLLAAVLLSGICYPRYLREKNRESLESYQVELKNEYNETKAEELLDFIDSIDGKYLTEAEANDERSKVYYAKAVSYKEVEGEIKELENALSFAESDDQKKTCLDKYRAVLKSDSINLANSGKAEEALQQVERIRKYDETEAAVNKQKIKEIIEKYEAFKKLQKAMESGEYESTKELAAVIGNGKFQNGKIVNWFSDGNGLVVMNDGIIIYYGGIVGNAPEGNGTAVLWDENWMAETGNWSDGTLSGKCEVISYFSSGKHYMETGNYLASTGYGDGTITITWTNAEGVCSGTYQTIDGEAKVLETTSDGKNIYVYCAEGDGSYCYSDGKRISCLPINYISFE